MIIDNEPRVLYEQETQPRWVWFIEEDGALHWSHLAPEEAHRE